MGVGLDGRDSIPRAAWGYWFLVLGILHDVRGDFPDDVLGAAVGPIFTGLELQGKWTHSGPRNVVGKFISHTVQNP